MSNETTDPPSDPEPPQDGRVRGRLYSHLHRNSALSLTSKIIITVVGTLVFLAGVVMLVTPGPAFVMIPLGLAILATEWDWADRMLQVAKKKAIEAKERAEAMDPKVRRRRLLLTGLAFIIVVGGGATYVAVYDWPSIAVSSWDWIQGIAGWVPELPGM